jgi:hypothetical protein
MKMMPIAVSVRGEKSRDRSVLVLKNRVLWVLEIQCTMYLPFLNMPVWPFVTLVLVSL